MKTKNIISFTNESVVKNYSELLGDIVILETLMHSSSDGNLCKWKVQQCNTGKIFWLKASSEFNGEIMYECESECFCCELATIMGLESVFYYAMDKLHLGHQEIKVCVSEHYDFENVYLYADVIPGISTLYGKEKYSAVTNLIPEMKQRIDNILLFDIIVANSDRHLLFHCLIMVLLYLVTCQQKL